MNLTRSLSLALLCLSIFLGNGCGADPNQPHRAVERALHPRVGGMELPEAGPAQPAGVLATTSAALEAGQTVAVVGDTPLRLLAGASSDALVLEVYPAGKTFLVIEPSGVVTSYPVLSEGRAWYRLQAEDGLVGWAPLDATHIETRLQGSDAD